MSLNGKVALVIGGGRGIGAAAYRLLAQQGASVTASYLRNQPAAKALAASVRAEGGKISVYQSDARDPDQVRELVQRVFDHEKRLDILVHSAPA